MMATAIAMTSPAVATARIFPSLFRFGSSTKLKMAHVAAAMTSQTRRMSHVFALPPSSLASDARPDAGCTSRSSRSPATTVTTAPQRKYQSAFGIRLGTTIFLVGASSAFMKLTLTRLKK